MRIAAGLLLSTLAMLVAGCESDSGVVAKWSKPGASYDDFLKARSDCMAEARAQSGGYYIGSVYYPAKGDRVSASDFVPCMGAHGYAADPKGYAAPEGDEIELGQ